MRLYHLLLLLLSPMVVAAAARLRDNHEDILHVLPPSSSKSTAEKYHAYRRFIPSPRKLRTRAVLPSYKESFPPAFTGECASEDPLWQTCDAAACTASSLPDTRAMPTLFNQTLQGQDGREYLQQVLRRAWGENPPMIDLYVRTGCAGAEELNYLLQTVALFYPNFLGDIIIVLDVNDQPAVDYIVPKRLLRGFSVHVVYEHQPCLPARFFNQYSYLNLFRYSQAEFAVTLDSDCAFFRPVTPDVLFNSKGELLVPTSKSFQPTYWCREQFFFTRLSYAAFGHSMVSQPVNVRVETLPKLFALALNRSMEPVEETASPTVQPQRRSLQEDSNITTTSPTPPPTFDPTVAPTVAPTFAPTEAGPRCYEGLMLDFVRAKGNYEGYFYCWMCQLSTFIKHSEQPGYKILVTDGQKPEEPGVVPYMRYASHVTYETADYTNYQDSVVKSSLQGVCYWLDGEGKRFTECATQHTAAAAEPDYAYILRMTFYYTNFDLNAQFTAEAKTSALQSARARLQHFV